jgi:methyltransferase (TIGR00027 family)
MSSLSSTAYGTAFFRAVDNLLPEDKRIIDDCYSEKLLPPAYKFFVIVMRVPALWKFLMYVREKSTPGIVGGIIGRTRYIDDLFIDAVKKGIGSVVNLGAGVDSRTFRIPGIENVRYFELDLPEVVEFKKSIINKKLGGLPSNLFLVPIDFDSQDPGEVLEKAGYDPSAKTFFIWEGVTQYISPEAIDNTLKFVSRSVAGSKIAFTYVLESFINGSHIPDGLDFLYKYMLKKKDRMWFSGFEPAAMSQYPSQYSLSLIEDVGYEICQEHYFKPRERNLTVMVIERAVLAEVK